MSGAPTTRDCERCLAEILSSYRGRDDLTDLLSVMNAGDSEDVLILIDAVSHGRPASPEPQATCASCAADHGLPR